MYCDRCGNPVSREQRACPKCGTPVRIEDLNGGFYRIVSRQEAETGGQAARAAQNAAGTGAPAAGAAGRDPARDAAADQLRAAKQQLQEKDTALQKAELLRKVLLIACGVLLLLLLIQTIRAGIYKGRAAKAAETPSFYDTERSGETEAEPGLQDPSGVQDTPGVQDPAGTQDFLQPQGPGPQQAPGIQEAPGIQQAPDIQEAPGIPQGSGDTGSDYFPSTGAVTQESAESTEDRIRTQNQILGDFDAFKEAASRPGMSGGD